MKLLAVGDRFIPADVMQAGLQSLVKAGVEITVREWQHPSLEALQKDNLIVEQHGPEVLQVPEELLAGIEQYDILVVQFVPVSKSLLDRALKLRLVGVLRGGVENIAWEYAASKNISVLNTVGRNARAVAEFTVGMILSEVRNIARSHAALHRGFWMKPISQAVPEICHKTVGIVGFGNVGRLLSGYLHAFGCNVVAFDPYIKEETVDQVRILSLPELLRTSEIVCLCARLTDENYHLIGKEQLSLMKKEAVLVNTARSGLIDQKSLVEALKERKIRGAALDVFDMEPLPADDELLRLDNVTITSHLAGSTREAFTNSPKLMASVIEGLLSGNGNNLPVVNGIKPVL